jgi:putative intracellular protease/amidase
MAPKEVLVIASNWGFWGEELQAAWDALRKAGHETVLATPRGLKPLPFAISVDPNFVDPVQQYRVNPPEVCARVKELLANGELDHPIKVGDATMSDYDALVMAGGPGTDLDMTNNSAIHRLVSEAVAQDKLVAAICFSVACLAFTRDPANDYHSVVWGKSVTAHPREWDFTADLTYDLYQPTPDNRATNVITPGFLLPIQDIMNDAVGPHGRVIADPKTSRDNPCVVFDWPFLTATSVESSISYGNKIVEVLASR